MKMFKKFLMALMVCFCMIGFVGFAGCEKTPLTPPNSEHIDNENGDKENNPNDSNNNSDNNDSNNPEDNSNSEQKDPLPAEEVKFEEEEKLSIATEIISLLENDCEIITSYDSGDLKFTLTIEVVDADWVDKDFIKEYVAQATEGKGLEIDVTPETEESNTRFLVTVEKLSN